MSGEPDFSTTWGVREVEDLVAELQDCHCKHGVEADCNCARGCNCEELHEKLFAVLGKMVSMDDAERLMRHGTHCPECSERVRAELALRELMRRSCAQAAPHELRMRITQTVMRFSYYGGEARAEN